MEFVPSDAYIIMGHGEEPQVTLEEERNFKPCECKIKAKKNKDVTIGSRSNNGFMDLDSFFIVPNNCIIIVKANPGELTYGHNIPPLLNKIGSVENQELYRNPLSNTKELVKQLGPVSIYKPGDKCPNFNYTLFFYREDIERMFRSEYNESTTHLGLLKTPLKNPLGNKVANNIIRESIDKIYNESIFPKKETVIKLILDNILERAPTFKDMINSDKSKYGELLNKLMKFLSVTQKQLLKIGDDGIAKRPGVYYNFVCRQLSDGDNYYIYKSDGPNLENMKNVVNPNITSILQQPKSTQNLFRRILNETLRKRKPLIRNLYTGGKRTRKNRRKSIMKYKSFSSF